MGKEVAKRGGAGRVIFLSSNRQLLPKPEIIMLELIEEIETKLAEMKQIIDSRNINKGE